MKIFKILLTIFLCFFAINTAHAAHQLYADLDGISIPYGTKFELTLANDITTQNAAEGDSFQAYLTKDIYVNNKLILPSNTIFRGRVSAIQYSKSLSRPAVLYLTLDHVVTKTGNQLPINAGISTNFDYILKSDGALTTNGNYLTAVRRDLKTSGQIFTRTFEWGRTSANDLFWGAPVIFVPLSAIGGGAATVVHGAYSTLADLFRHGDEIIIKKGSTFDIILLSRLDIPS